MTKPTAEINRSTVHALSPMQSCRDRGRQSFIFHTKRQLGQFARSTLQDEFGKAQVTDDAESPAASVAPLHSHPAFAIWSALNIGSQQQMWRALGDMVSRQAQALDEAAEQWNKAATNCLNATIAVAGPLLGRRCSGCPHKTMLATAKPK